MIEDRLTDTDMLMSTFFFLTSVLETTGCHSRTALEDDKIILSVDGVLIKDGFGAAGWAVEVPGESTPRAEVKPTPTKDEMYMGLDAVYEALTSFFGLTNNPGAPVEVRSTCQETIALLNSEIGVLDTVANEKKESVLELVENLPVEITFLWRPKSSSLKGIELASRAVMEFIDKAIQEEDA